MTDIRTRRRFLSADDWATFSRPDFLTDQRRGIAPPPVEKPFPHDAHLIELVWPEQFAVGRKPLTDVVASRESRRKFAATPLGLEELSFLLWATQGVRRTVQQEGEPVRTFRNVPSGGGRHSLETYLVVNRVDEIPAGLYRYLPVEHKLLPLPARPNLPRQIAHACLDQTFIGESAVVFVWTAVPYRAEWRYSIVAHKMIAIDAGHVCQNLYLAAEAIGAGACAIAAYDQKAVDEVIGVDGEEEFVIYAAPVGFPA
jgi:SagB-type dehydrogenase family enzyme